MSDSLSSKFNSKLLINFHTANFPIAPKSQTTQNFILFVFSRGISVLLSRAQTEKIAVNIEFVFFFFKFSFLSYIETTV